jgi:uncharacterized protein
MSTEKNRRLLTSIFDSLATGDGRPLVDAMADDFRWRFAGEWSWARDWGRTKQEVRVNLLQPLMAQFAEYRCKADEIIAEADRVVVRATADAITIRGDHYPQSYCYVFRVENGRLAEILEYCDTALVERVLTLPDP